MNNKLILSIALGSFVGISAPTMAQADNPAPQAVAPKAKTSGGKCASGKCGTEKLYEKAHITHDPQDRLVRSRDGKCGLDARGDQAETFTKEVAEKCASGVCGQ